MIRRIGTTLAGLLFATNAFAQLHSVGGGEFTVVPTDRNETQIDAAFSAGMKQAQALGLRQAVTPQIMSAGNLLFPLRLRPASKAFRGNGISNYVDHDASTAIKDFSCGTRTYDGHRGIDLALYPYAWRMMDGTEVEIVAAAAGTIVNKADGEFDRQCQSSGSPPANFVIVLQDDGLNAMYWHMKKGSVTPVAVGQRVAAGDVLGLVGSSGRSTGPHLHFELRTGSGQTVDPFAGRCGARTTNWKHQPENIDTDILKIATHAAAPPAVSSSCNNPDPRYSDRFAPGAKVWGAVYLRDQRPNTPVVLSFVRPNGQVFASWTTSSISTVYRFSYWWGSITLPSSGANGTWKVRAKLEGREMEHAFVVGSLPAATRLNASVAPAVLNIGAGATAEFNVAVRNVGSRAAVGCTVVPDVPLAAVWNVAQIVPAAPAGELNRVFDLAVATTKKFRLSIKPKPGYKASAIRIPIHVSCLNANGPAANSRTVATLTF